MASGDAHHACQPPGEVEVSAVPCTTWPRLYLDTAELLDIADGTVGQQVLSGLIEEMALRRVILLLSVEHLQDALPRRSADAASRLADVVERFPYRAVVLQEPHEIEPWTDDTGDIAIAMVGNIREIVTAPAAAPVLARLTFAQDRLHAATHGAQQTRVATVLPRDTGTLALDCLVRLVRGRHGLTADDVMAAYEHERQDSLDAQTRSAVVAQLAPWADLLRELDRVFELTPERRLEILVGMRDTLDSQIHSKSPGLFLAARLATCLAANVARRVLRSDSVDAMHVRYFPYVDVATCDRQVYGCIERHLQAVRGPRRLVLCRNGRLSEVLGALRQLPDGSLPPTTSEAGDGAA